MLPRGGLDAGGDFPAAPRRSLSPSTASRTQGASARARVPDRGMLVLEQKLSILVSGPGQTRRNPALDVLTGRVPDERLKSLQASLMATRAAATPHGQNGPLGPTAIVVPVAAIRMAAVARSSRPAPSPWLQATAGDGQPRLRLIAPPPSRWSRVPWLGGLLVWLRAEYRPYRSSVRSPRVRQAS